MRPVTAWLPGPGFDRVVLTTDGRGLSGWERLDDLELRMLLHGWLGDRATRMELARLYAALTDASAPPPMFDRHTVERVVGAFIAGACSSGHLVALRRPREAHGNPPGAPARPHPPSTPPPPPSRPEPGRTPRAPTYFEVRYVDEVGEPIGGVPLELVAGGKHPRRRFASRGGTAPRTHGPPRAATWLSCHAPPASSPG